MFIDKVIVGPTASGKTKWAVRWAKENNAEIISADSRQIYTKLNIGTGKPTELDREGVYHHLIDVIAPEQCYSAGMFRTDTLNALESIRRRGKKALLVGGTGLYIRAVLERFLDLPAENTTKKNMFYEKCEVFSLPDLFLELKNRDPARSEEIMPNDRVRITRALWIHELTGVPPSVLYREKGLVPIPCGEIVGFEWDPEVLSQRISTRVHEMFARGWVQEVDQLLEQGYRGDEPAFQSLGYPEVLRVVRDGFPVEAAIRQIEIRTRQYAKRQRTWFRHLPEVKWVKPEDNRMNF